MSDTPTPGAIAYDAYWQIHQHDGHIHRPPPFAQLPAITRASWEAAAEAVLALKMSASTGPYPSLLPPRTYWSTGTGGERLP